MAKKTVNMRFDPKFHDFFIELFEDNKKDSPIEISLVDFSRAMAAKMKIEQEKNPQLFKKIIRVE